MARFLFLFCLLLSSFLLSLVAPGAAQAQAEIADVIPQQGRLVVDEAGLLSSRERDLLEQKLVAYDDSTSTQIAVVTLPSLGGVPSIDYATAVGRQWGVGQEGKDNGAVILVSKADRDIAIATGYGLEGAITDLVAGRVIRNVLRPAFRQEQYYQGLSSAVDVLVAAAQGEFAAEAPSRRDGGGINVGLIFVLLIIAFFVISALRDEDGGSSGGSGFSDGSGKRRRRRRGGVFPIFIGGGSGGSWGGSSSGGFGGGGFGGGGGGFGGFGGGGFGGGGASGGW